MVHSADAATAPNTLSARPDAIPLWAWAALLGVLGVRLALLAATPLELYPDEAQYWRWAQEPAWGYFSKPPLIAWLIAATTAMFGDAEWAVRLSAPLCHALTTAILMLLGRDLYGARAGVLAGALWLTMGGVALSSLVISTDAPLLTLWSLMLLSLFRLLARPAAPSAPVWAFALGAALGLGMMAKYAMLYALVVLALAVVLHRPVRAVLLSRHGVLAGLSALAFLAPNLIWNALHGMTTVVHTAANANWQGSLFHPVRLLEFWGAQLGVFGIVAFPLLLLALVRALRGRMDSNAALLALFVIAPLLIVSVQALVSRANANWAAAAYPAGAVLTAALLTNPEFRLRAWRGLTAMMLAANLLLVVPGSAAMVWPAMAEAAGMSNSLRRLTGWRETTRAIHDAAREAGVDIVVFDDRFVFHGLDYYGRDTPDRPGLRMWRRYDGPSAHAETCCALTPGTEAAAGPVLLVSRFTGYDPWLAADFATLEDLGAVVVERSAGARERRLRLFLAAGYDPVRPRDREFPPE